jgi:hypothetical protein
LKWKTRFIFRTYKKDQNWSFTPSATNSLQFIPFKFRKSFISFYDIYVEAEVLIANQILWHQSLKNESTLLTSVKDKKVENGSNEEEEKKIMEFEISRTIKSGKFETLLFCRKHTRFSFRFLLWISNINSFYDSSCF